MLITAAEARKRARSGNKIFADIEALSAKGYRLMHIEGRIDAKMARQLRSKGFRVTRNRRTQHSSADVYIRW